MAYEHKFRNMAINESEFNDFDQNPHIMAASLCRGAIGLADDTETREGFIQAGLDFLNRFKEDAALKIELEEEADEPRQALIEAIKELVGQSVQVDRDEFADLLGEDWDERHADENAPGPAPAGPLFEEIKMETIEWIPRDDGEGEDAEVAEFGFYVHYYQSGGFCWQVWLKNNSSIRQYGPADTLQEARSRALEWNGRREELIDRYVKTEFEKLAKLRPNLLADVSFRAGYHAGLEAARQALSSLAA